MCPQNFERGGELPPLVTPPRVGPKTLVNPQPTRVGKPGGSRGAKPPWQGVWGMCPQNFERGGELPPLVTPPRVGPKTLANHQPTRVGKPGGSRGAKPPWQGVWGDTPPKRLLPCLSAFHPFISKLSQPTGYVRAPLPLHIPL